MRNTYFNKNVDNFNYHIEDKMFIGYSNDVRWYGDTRDIMLHNNRTHGSKMFYYKEQLGDDFIWQSDDGIKLVIKK